MREDAEGGREDGEAVDEAEDELEDHDGEDEFCEEAFRDDGVLLDELGEVVESRR